MNIRRVWVALALLSVVVFAAALSLPDTLAFIAAQSNKLHNTFRVEYLPAEDITVPVHVYKTVRAVTDERISPEGFRFLLTREDGEELILTSGADGFALATLTFTAADAGKTYTYQLTELDDAQEFITYSDAAYTIRIAITLDAQNRLVPAIAMDGEKVTRLQAEFVNVYDPTEVPDTGDHTCLLLYAGMMLLGAAGLFALSRRPIWNRREYGC